MKVMVTGARGQLGTAVAARLKRRCEVYALGRQELDICDPTAITKFMATQAPDAIVNCSAYTAVDKAESEPEQAYLVNATGAENLAKAAARSAIRLIHVSTDFVFDGKSSVPYCESDRVNPLSVYGKSKHAGEQAVLAANGDRATIVRTSWVYSGSGHNFMKTMLALFSQRDEVGVVYDQVAAPTSTESIAAVIDALLDRDDCQGIFHWTNAGVASWYDFAVAIAEEARSTGLINRPVFVRPIESKDFPTAARRPHYSVLNCSKLQATLPSDRLHWREGLRQVLTKMVQT